MDEPIKELTECSIAELDHIIRNYGRYPVAHVNAAKQLIEIKRAEWKALNISTSKKIDEIVRKEKWFDFHVLSYDGNQLIIGGGIDLTYYHQLELIFEGVFFASAYFKGWHSNTDQIVFQIPTNEVQLNFKYQIEENYQLFEFKIEDGENDILIAANSVSFNTDTVFYYDRPDLQANERIAPFVKKNAL